MDFVGGASWIRTSDTRIFSPLLYRLSYGTFQVFVLNLLLSDLVVPAGFEPATQGFSVLCSTD